MLKSIMILFIFIFSTSIVFSQSDNPKVVKLKSNLCKIITKNAITGKNVEQQDFVDNLIVINYITKKICIYLLDNKIFDIDILAALPIKETDSFMDIPYNCLDGNGIKCAVNLALDKDKSEALFFKIIYPEKELIFYFL